MWSRPKTYPKSGRWSAVPAELRLLAVLACALVCGIAGAATAGTPSCTVSASGVAFGPYDPADDADAAGDIDVFCTCVTGNDCTDLPYSLEIQAGLSGSTTARALLPGGGGAQTLSYGLFQDSGRTANWGTGVEAVGRTYPIALYGSSQRTQVYGRVPQGQYVPAGTYGETPAIALFY